MILAGWKFAGYQSIALECTTRELASPQYHSGGFCAGEQATGIVPLALPMPYNLLYRTQIEVHGNVTNDLSTT